MYLYIPKLTRFFKYIPSVQNIQISNSHFIISCGTQSTCEFDTIYFRRVIYWSIQRSLKSCGQISDIFCQERVLLESGNIWQRIAMKASQLLGSLKLYGVNRPLLSTDCHIFRWPIVRVTINKTPKHCSCKQLNSNLSDTIQYFQICFQRCDTAAN